jgi:hypothetical protein
MRDWVKLRCDLPRHVKIHRAGEDGLRLFIGLICLNGERGVNGIIPAAWCSPDDIAFTMPALQLSSEQICTALKKLADAGLVENSDDGIRLLGYDEEFMPKCTRCTKPNPEGSYRTCPKCRSYSRASKSLQSADDNTNGAGSCTTGQDRTRTGKDKDRIGAGGEGAAPCLAATGAAGICSVLKDAGWGNSDTHREERAVELAARWSESEIRRVWEAARKNGKDPRRYFAKLLKSNDWIWEIVTRKGEPK